MNNNLKLAAELEKKEKWEEAFQIYKEIYDNSKNDKILFKLGFLASKLKNHNESITYYKEYLKRYPKDFYAYHNLGIEYFLIQDYEKSKKMLMQSIELKPDFIRSHLLLGYLNEIVENYENALKIFSSVLKIDNKNKLAAEGVILSLIKLKQYEKSFEICNRFLQIYPDDLTLKNLKTGILIYLNRSDEFYQELKEITEKSEKYKSFEKFIKDFQNQREQKYTEFAKEVQNKLILKTKELQEKEDSKTYLDLSLLSLFSGEKEKALEYLKKALETKSKEKLD